jgi:hypothetical protein
MPECEMDTLSEAPPSRLDSADFAYKIAYLGRSISLHIRPSLRGWNWWYTLDGRAAFARFGDGAESCADALAQAMSCALERVSRGP